MRLANMGTGRGSSPGPCSGARFASFRPRAERLYFPEELKDAVRKAVGDKGLETVLEALKDGKGENGAQLVCTQMKTREVLVGAFDAAHKAVTRNVGAFEAIPGRAAADSDVENIRQGIGDLKLIRNAVERLDKDGKETGSK